VTQDTATPQIPRPVPPADEPRDTAIRRLQMRSMRRGIKEMDLVLSAYSRDRLTGMSDAELALYDQLLEENDQDLLRWITGMDAAPGQFAALIADISARGRTW
tara:strand:+ start:49 stop:357 length:309 start_codon:yes stop_codon:yes gene_type:complete